MNQPFRKGDMVTAKSVLRATKKEKGIPEGTVGTILIAPSQPSMPRAVYVEWRIPSRAMTEPVVVKRWHHDTELDRLTGK